MVRFNDRRRVHLACGVAAAEWPQSHANSPRLRHNLCSPGFCVTTASDPILPCGRFTCVSTFSVVFWRFAVALFWPCFVPLPRMSRRKTTKKIVYFAGNTAVAAAGSSFCLPIHGIPLPAPVGRLVNAFLNDGSARGNLEIILTNSRHRMP